MTATDPHSRAIADFDRNWTYRPSPFDAQLAGSRLLRRMLLRGRAPRAQTIVAADAAARWTCYFAYLPDGVAAPLHLYTLDRLAAEPGRLLVVCATDSPDAIPAAIRERADALIWKSLGGFDFSGYRLMLRHLAERSPGADVFVMNDSVFGPFASPAAVLADRAWDLTAFTASTRIENHIQSYAFQLRALTPERFAALASVFGPTFNRYTDVVLCQETRFARVAAKTMSVGACWFADSARVFNPTLDRGVALAHAGLPFVKRSLLGRHGHREDSEAVRALLEDAGHPIEVQPA
ncbi:lipopolysaccharide biosynthesis protein [Sphingomonas jinjuensis]|uniref:Lipopolysaccharide biosynthesis protein n=1 Tax=Sphingomonas jinjuensis TaxID=535907 RepID=A0A840FPD9_9SPHN|nr:hypothetical protein [Sphingomonas jinjuensis]MBB4155145.1 lipopolysaccharide biosynthesis protein [Sphingomonas jinjuensis]